jgi:hypothetical protein
MRKRILFILPALLLMTLAASIPAYAQQGAEKKEAEKTTTIDAWRQALPDADQSLTTPPPDVREEPVEGEETPAQVEKRILELERRLMEAHKTRDSVTLKRLLAKNFVLAGINITGSTATGAAAEQTDKDRYIGWALKNLELKNFNLEKPTVRVFPSTVIVTFNYKRQANVSGAPADGDFTVTNVWVKQGKRWQAASHHISPLPKQ